MRVLFLEKTQNYGDSFPFLNSETFRRASDSDPFCKYAYIKKPACWPVLSSRTTCTLIDTS